MIREFNPEIYPRRLWVGYACTDAEIKGYFGDNVTNIPKDSDASTGSCYRPKVDRGGVFINFRSKETMTPPIIAHESTHAALEIFDYL